jgi:hypothetical protein
LLQQALRDGIAVDAEGQQMLERKEESRTDRCLENSRKEKTSDGILQKIPNLGITRNLNLTACYSGFLRMDNWM